MEKLTLNVGELARQLGIGRNAAYALCHQQGFPAVFIGKRVVIPVESLREWLKVQGQGQDAE